MHTLTTDQIVSQAEQLMPSPVLEGRIDEYYAGELLEQIPDFAERTPKLAKLLVKNRPI